MNNFKLAFVIILCLAIALFSFAACGTDANKEEGEIDPGVKNVEPLENDITNGLENIESGNVFLVYSAEDLIETIAPNVAIVIENGYYNLSEYLEEAWENEGEYWNQRHQYVQLRDTFDGVELVIKNVDNLAIIGDKEHLTEIVVEPRYATVLNFEWCKNITLSNLTIGHTETGECDGSVLRFYESKNVSLKEVDLYGCGSYGIYSECESGDIKVTDSIIRECSNGALFIVGGIGDFSFTNTSLIDSEGFGFFEKTGENTLKFSNCTFGEMETSYFMFLEDIELEDCIFSEDFIYPEYPEYTDETEATDWVG